MTYNPNSLCDWEASKFQTSKGSHKAQGADFQRSIRSNNHIWNFLGVDEIQDDPKHIRCDIMQHKRPLNDKKKSVSI